VATRRRASQRSLTGSISDIQRRVKYLQNRQTPTRLGNQAVQRSAIQYRAVGTDQIALNSIVNDQIQANAIAQAQLSDDSVGRDEIINGEVVEAKLGTDAVTRTKIKDGEVITGKLGSAAVELVNMSPNSVANTQLTTDSVNFRTVDTNAIGNENMLDNSVGNSELQNDSVGSGELQSDSVGFAELQSGSVGNSTLQTGSVTRAKLGSGSVGETQIAGRAVTGAKIATNTILLENLNGITPIGIVQNGLQAGAGLVKGGGGNQDIFLSASFGTGFSNVARGNHSHGTFVGLPNSGGAGAVTFANHKHQVTVLASSSVRYKKDISTHKIDEPEKILNLELKKYKYKNSKKMYHQAAKQEWMYGYIAEEVHEMGFDEILGFDDDGNPDSINYGLVSVILLEVVKEQHKDIKNLKNRLTILEENYG
jgi:hypothetical protein